ncbi:MAG: aldo/keto reductase [Bacteroidales bacterium]|nr:aldo/keto reductase [Bacteroidales bacterium]
MKRRDFIKKMGGAAVATSVVLSACTSNDKKAPTAAPGEVVDGQGEMTYRVNPNSGDKVSLLGYGMMRLPMVDGATFRDNPNAQVDQDMVNQQIDYALEHGVNYFDTAPVYTRGHSEVATGIALSRHPRKSYYLATKLSNFSPATRSAEASKEMFENSLKKLQTDYVDYLLMHSIGGTEEGRTGMDVFNNRFIENGILDWLVEQKKLGRIRNLGFSFHGEVEVFDTMMRWHDEGRYHWDFVQIQMNYADWNYANRIDPDNVNASYLYNELHRRGIPGVIMEPLLGGRLAKLPDFIVKQMQEREPETPVARWAFRYAGTPEGILVVLSGMTYMEHLIENVATYSPLRPITPEEDEFLMKVAEEFVELKTIPCTACNYCMPCPYGLNIPAIFAYYNDCITEGKMPAGNPEAEEYRRNRRAFLVGYDRTIPSLRQANHCIGCHQCESHCPQKIAIPKEMQRIDEFVEELKQQ